MVSPISRLRALQHMAQKRRSAALQAAIAAGFLDDGDADDYAAGAVDFTPVVSVMDLDLLAATAATLRFDAGFPHTALHTVAVKANPVGGVMRLFKDLGLGAEAASLGELMCALEAGFDPRVIVFDSPAKTVRELAFALAKGVALNIDNAQELARAAALLEAHPEWLSSAGGGSNGGGGSGGGDGHGDGGPRLIGLRVNPQVGAGSIAALSTGGAVSKFGFPLLEERAAIVAAFVRHPWLNMLHLHVGSQGMPTALIAEGVARVWALLEEIDAACGARRVVALDIGGGLSVDFGTDAPGPYDAELAAAAAAAADAGPKAGAGAAAAGQQQGEGPQGAGGAAAAAAAAEGGEGYVWTRFQEQAALLRARVPALFEPSRGVRLITENGRSLLAKAGFVAARVEYTKVSGGRRIAVCHAGADLFTRACYLPEVWGVRLEVCDAAGRRKEAQQGPPPPPPPPGQQSQHEQGQEGQQQQQGRQPPQQPPPPLQDVAGPLCFQGDRLAVASPNLPVIEPNDYVLALDAGAYVMSMASRYNSRPSPAVLGFAADAVAGAPGGRVKVLRGRETAADVVRYWNLPHAPPVAAAPPPPPGAGAR